jgi:hypothetical protein
VYVVAVVSLASLLEVVQQAHTSIRRLQLQQGDSSSSTHKHSSSQTALVADHPQQQQSAAESAAWQQFAASLAWPKHCQQHSWDLSRLYSSMQCWGSRLRTSHSAPAAAAAADSPSVVWQNASSSASSSSSSSAVVLPGLLQHLVGIAVAALLLQHWNELLLCAAAAGSWLQQQLLQPHIDWLMQAHPGAIVSQAHSAVFLCLPLSSVRIDLTCAECLCIIKPFGET